MAQILRMLVLAAVVYVGRIPAAGGSGSASGDSGAGSRRAVVNGRAKVAAALSGAFRRDVTAFERTFKGGGSAAGAQGHLTSGASVTASSARHAVGSPPPASHAPPVPPLAPLSPPPGVPPLPLPRAAFPFKRGHPERPLHFLHVTKSGGTTIEDAAMKAGIRWGRFDWRAGMQNSSNTSPSGWHLCPRYVGPAIPRAEAALLPVHGQSTSRRTHAPCLLVYTGARDTRPCRHGRACAPAHRPALGAPSWLTCCACACTIRACVCCWSVTADRVDRAVRHHPAKGRFNALYPTVDWFYVVREPCERLFSTVRYLARPGLVHPPKHSPKNKPRPWTKLTPREQDRFIIAQINCRCVRPPHTRSATTLQPRVWVHTFERMSASASASAHMRMRL